MRLSLDHGLPLLTMPWQTFVNEVDMLRVGNAMPPSSFNPAITGRFLMTVDGLQQMAHNVGYVFAQFTEPLTKQPAIDYDLPRLGRVREPWQVGTYAYLMLQAYHLTSNREYRDEASRALTELMTSVRYTEANEMYARDLADPVDFPITEPFGQVYGIAASLELYAESHDPRFLRFARGFLDTLLRLTPWSEDTNTELTRVVRHAGLFYCNGGVEALCPWETVEANIGLTYAIANDPTNPLVPLLLKLTNLNRVNSFFFYPATFTPPLEILNRQRSSTGWYWPVENLPTIEEPNGGDLGPKAESAAYMASNALWNYWMYEALAESSDPDVLALNTDVLGSYETPLSGAERHIVVFNPTAGFKRFALLLHALPDGRYQVIGAKSGMLSKDSYFYDIGSQNHSVEMTLAAGQFRYLTIRATDGKVVRRKLETVREAQRALSAAYAVAQNRGEQLSQEELLSDRETVRVRDLFQSGVAAYGQGNYQEAIKDARAASQVSVAH